MPVAAIDFDPYRDWLKITDHSRPLSPYQLLRLAPLEADLSKIRVAYTRQANILEAQANGGDDQLVQALSDELRQAFETLADAERKAVVDGEIRRRTKVSVPQPSAEAQATAGHSVRCRHCEKANPPNRRFCGDCGQPLWEKCPQCSAECAADERFCGECGADIRGELAGKERSFRDQLAAATQAADEFRFDSAISQFRKLAAIDDVRFTALAQQAVQAIAQTQRRRDEQLQSAELALARSIDLVANHSYELAITTLSDVPPLLRSPAAESLLEQATAARQELLQLGSEIRHGMLARQYPGLLLKIERMLSLKPGHTQAQEIAGQLRDHFYKLAKAEIGKFQYANAVEILTQIPELFRTSDVHTLADLALELSALLQTVQETPLAEESLRGLADKLGKFAAQNEDVAKLRQRLANRLQKSPPDARLGAPEWQPSPIKSALGPPVDWLAYFTRLEATDEKLRATLKEHPGEFYIALGLALQGVDVAEVPLNLMSVEKGSVLSRIKNVFSRKGPALAWGIDLGDRALKAIQLARDEETGVIEIIGCEYLTHENLLAGPDADLVRSEVLGKTLQDFVSRVDLKGCQVIAALPASRVLGRFCEIPPLPAKKVPQTVQYEARHQFPVALDELNWAYYVLNEAEGKAADETPRRVMMVAARAAHVQQRVQLFKRTGIEVNILQSECVALHNALRYEFASGETEKHEADHALAVVDVGVSSTSVVISSPKGLWFRNFGQAGNNFTTQLVKQFQLTHEQAEQLKRDPARARRYHLFQSAMQPVLVQLCGEIERSVSTYQKQNPEHTIRRIYGIGGGFQTHGLLRQLRFGK